jgi:hypothetical protein
MTSWQAIVLEGPEHAIRGFVAGFVAGRGAAPGEVVLADELHLDEETLAGRLRDFLSRRTHHVVLAAPALAASLVAAVQAGAAPDVRLGHHEPVRTVAFDFDACTASPEAAARIHDVLLGELPAGVTRIDAVEEGAIDPSQHGPHLRDPAHEFTYRARGTVCGDPLPMVALRRVAEELDFVTVTPLRLLHDA